jgi:hypothetical protein
VSPGYGSISCHATTLVSLLSAEVIVKLVPALRAVTAMAFGPETVPRLCTVTKMRESAVTVLSLTVTVPAVRVAVPCLRRVISVPTPTFTLPVP